MAFFYCKEDLQEQAIGADKMEFKIEDKFYLDGNPFQIISGSIHYFRVVPEYWRDRLEKLKNMGCNTVETYIPWNFHEPKKGKFEWSGMHDVIKFIEIAQELDLYIIIRPSPYICAEWEWGGLPAWLMAEPQMQVRCSYKPYLEHVKSYYEELIPKLVPYQIDHGGKIILMQIENEYGYYGDDKEYLNFLADLMRKLGITVPFVTSDGPWSKSCFCAGQVENALPTGNFGSACEWQFGQMKKMMPKNKPLMCMEFWAGWFDAWGNKKKKSSKLKINEIDFDYVLKNGHNINIYMFHGGTNFGFMNGSNCYGKLTPDTTSYDYDAPLTEDGKITKKYEAFRKIIKKYKEVPDVQFSTKISQKAYGKIQCKEAAPLFENLKILSLAMQDEGMNGVVKSVTPLSMEQAGQDYGYILYHTKMNDKENASSVMFKKCADRVQVFADKKKVITAFDTQITSEAHGHWPFTFKEGKEWKFSSQNGAELDFLVENMGRTNFGHELMNQKKGITENLLVNGIAHFGWEIYPLPLNEIQIAALCKKGIWKKSAENENPAFFRFEFDADELCDTYLDFAGWGKGCVWVNGFNIGRFWEKGPQRRLYIPAPLLKTGKNEIIIFETEGKCSSFITLCDELKFDL